MIINENNIQAPFQYKINENTFELLKRNGELELNTNNVQVKVFEGQRFFCADIGYAIDGPLENMEFLIDDIKVYPIILEELKDLQTVEVKDNEIYLIKEDINFKSIIFFPPSDLNKNFKFNITTYSSTFSSFMFDEIAKKLNSLDTNYPIKNYYENTDYKVNDIIKYDGYLYRVFKDFQSDNTNYYLKNNCNLITPFKKLELNTEYKINDLVEYNNNFFTVQSDFIYEEVTNLNGLLKPLQDIIIWFDGIRKIYKNQIIIKDNITYIVIEDIENPIWENIQSKLYYLNKASNTFYDDTNSGFGNNTNTVQKAIEKLKSDKQDSLIAGNNIDLNGNTISVIGGTNKEYVINDNYHIDDLIIYDSKLYKVNENFIATDWTADRNKCTLVGGGGSEGATDAIDVNYDNSKTNLEYISGYDFPKFKTPIPDTINLVFTDNTNDYPATITKQEDGSYILNCQLDNIAIEDVLNLFIKSIDNKTNVYEVYSELSQFFECSPFLKFEHLYNCLPNEINISEINKEDYIFVIQVSELGVLLTISSKSGITKNNYNITLNIKNRVLKNIGSDLFLTNNGITSVYNLKFINNNGDVKLSGNIQNIKSGLPVPALIGFYSPIMENYFDIVFVSNTKVTSEIISSTGKTIKYCISKNDIGELPNESPLYILVLQYEDGTDIQESDVFTFNLTPDKNSTVDPIYSTVSNIQDAIEAIVQRLILLEN